MSAALLAFFKSIANIFSFLSLRQKGKNDIAIDAGHKQKQKNIEEEKLKDSVEEIIKNVDLKSNEEQEKYLDMLRKIIAE